jgi:exosome complex component RRP40
MEPELECFDAQTRKAEGFGELNGGFLVRCSLRMCRKCVIIHHLQNTSDQVLSSLLDPNHFLLPLLGATFPLEVAVGLNGRVWVNSKEAKHIIAISRAIESTDPDGDNMDAKAVKRLVEDLDSKMSL